MSSSSHKSGSVDIVAVVVGSTVIVEVSEAEHPLEVTVYTTLCVPAPAKDG